MADIVIIKWIFFSDNPLLVPLDQHEEPAGEIYEIRTEKLLH